MEPDILPGLSYPLGATVFADGVNFSVFSKNGDYVELLFFNDVDDENPIRTIRLDPKSNRTFYYWHVFVKGIGHGQLYGYRVYGTFKPEQGFCFDGWKVLLDPYARAVCVGKNYEREAAIRSGNNCGQAMKSVVVDAKRYKWDGDKPLHYPYTRSIIYEMHVGGFTRNPNSGVAKEKRGTFAGLIEKIPYLKALGITAVELLPVQQFDEHDAPKEHTNYWGYSPIAFFAPHFEYSSRKDPLGPVDEFRDMVKALHKTGIEVILDVVFNHTAEGNRSGPIFSFKGFENKAYYILTAENNSYANYSGCGNTLKTHHSIVRRLIMDCLHYWVTYMHVDGFRFDLASVFSRDEDGVPMQNPPILWSIESDPWLAGTKIIAEAWDAAGLYQVGSFVGHRWAEWNGRFRDDIRMFMKGDARKLTDFVNRITASPDLYSEKSRDPNRSINFITCHDGFTLNDLVSYNVKHNENNSENNLDGQKENYSWNCGEEGQTQNEAINQLRLRQIKNFFTLLMISQGTAMMQMGDEIRRTQYGNNNAYCQDNDMNWFDWDAVKKNTELLAFVKNLIRMNLTHEIFQETTFWTDKENRKSPRITWHGVHLSQPDWSDDSHSIAFTLNHEESRSQFHVMINAYWEPLSFELPPLPGMRGRRWHRVLDTALSAPDDFPETPPAFDHDSYVVEDRSIVILGHTGRALTQS
ncbi:glycogen debranching enzyme GlgX [Chloroherpeton thalassium ATCC 35110]|uniref:Glycogen debranching enzyme GlgX n=1 Tax=Chloroherpeton thalassium (strain ATCC 35110 / GB-78) TaxID=517418 RepID=B3QYN5_CHLT3|nr:glycogen debranching protein GlgX [Chloroherpeton thalassium]ACF15108.1 glycogen debranching enzyme GlgX [Chloroherpeton thalassium ATCC 35110]